jgi:hypothetical protein
MDMPNQTGAKKSSLALKIIGGIVAVVVIVLVIYVISMFSTAGITSVVDNQLNFLKTDNYIAAYELTSSDFRNGVSLEAFTTYVNQYPALSKNVEYKLTEKSIEDDQGTIKGTFTDAERTALPITFRFIKQGVDWKILSIEIGTVESVE